GEYGLILLDSDDPVLRVAESDMFVKLIEGSSELEQALFKGKSAVEQSGSKAGADVKENGANLFFIQEGERLLLSRNETGSEYGDKAGAVRFTASELRELAVSRP